ncbi:hypothetical protein ES703_107411 [subsurface metagenome]
MTLMAFKGVGITGISACVPKQVIKNIELEGIITDRERKNVIEATGIIERRFHFCSVFLFFKAITIFFMSPCLSPTEQGVHKAFSNIPQAFSIR